MDITENIENIIEEPIHGRKFYTDDNIITLKRKLIEIYERINLEKLEEKDIIKYIGDFVKNNVKYRIVKRPLWTALVCQKTPGLIRWC